MTTSAQGRVYGGVDPETRKAERRLRFIAAGIQIIGRAGYRAATVRALCAEAGLTDRYYYESFANTEELLLAVVAHLTDRARSRVAQAAAAAGTDPEAIARAALGAYFQEVQDPLYGRITLTEVLGVSEAVDRAYTENMRQFATYLVALARPLAPGIRLGKADEEIVGIALSGAVVMAAAGWMLQGYPYSLKRMVDNSMTVLLGTARQLAGR